MQPIFSPCRLLNYLNEIGGLHERVMGSCVQPGCATAHESHRNLPAFQIDVVYVRYFQFTTRAWLQCFAMATTSLS